MWTLRLAPGVAVAPPGGGEAVAALALGKKGEDEGAEEVLTAALTLWHAELLPEGKADAEGREALAAALSDWLALAQPLVLALARPVAQMPSPLKSSGQPEALLCREAEAVALTEGLVVAQTLAALLSVALSLTLGAAEATSLAETLWVPEVLAERVPWW